MSKLPKKGEAIKTTNHEIGLLKRSYNRNTKNIIARRKNAMLQGGGAGGTQDRGAQHSIATYSKNPYFQSNFFFKWRELVNWYFTDWAARKIINIPIDDALRKEFTIKGIEKADAEILMKRYRELNADEQIKRAMRQERLLGGSLIYMCIADNSDTVDKPIDYKALRQGDLRAINVIDIQKIWQTDICTDPFNPAYEKPLRYAISGSVVDHSRIIIFDGDPLFNRASVNIYQPWRINPSGFGESVLTPLYDLMVRVTGTQEGAYHLINLASVLLATVDDLKGLKFTNSAALDKLQEIMQQISIYRSAILDGHGVEIKQHTASFGSIPELFMAFLQILSAASDIPATRFLGQAPGGLSTDDAGGKENYYNVVDAIQTLKCKPAVMKILTIIGICEWGLDAWKDKSQQFNLYFPPLHNLDEEQQAELNKTTVDTFVSLYQDGLLNMEQTLEELKSRNIFMTEIDIKKAILEKEAEDAAERERELLDGQSELEKLKTEADNQ
jgi:hypothetical protein